MRKYMDANKPGRVDVNGVMWWATDPYPTWFRRDEHGDIIERDDFDAAPWADSGALREPCGAYNPWPGENPPCGRPKGHSADSTGKGGSWHGGHAEKPGDDDPPTRRYERRWVIV